MSSTINQDLILSGKVSTQEVPLSGKVSTQDVLLSGKVATLETLIGPPGPQGPKGDSGDSYTVKGLYSTLSALQAAHPTGSAGDAWFVGTSENNVVYQWDVDQSAWVNVGVLKGPKGDKGDPGAAGKDGIKWWTYNGVFASSGEKIWLSYNEMPNASIGDFVLHTRNDAGVVYEITGRDPLNYGQWLVKKKCVLKGTDGTTPNIGANGNWYLGTMDTGKPSRGATGAKGDKGEDGIRGRGWYQDIVDTLNPQIYMWTIGSLAPKWGEGDWLYDPDNGNVGLCTSRTDKADGSGSASITYKGTLKGADGSSIQSIERTSGTGAPGTTDTYTVTLTNGDTTTFQVYNGKDGSGSGDMTKAVYDPKGKAQDIFAYADAKQAKITASGILKGNGAGGVSAAEAGTDYVASPEVFVATYGSTTFAEIKAAYDAGKVCFCKKGSEIKQLVTLKGSILALFGGVKNTSILTLWKIKNDDTWSEDVTNGYTPESHASTHASGGADPITPASIGAAVPSVGVTATLTAAGWDADTKTQTVSVAVVTATDNCIITAAPDSYMSYAKAGVRCTAQGAGTLTFACETVPTDNVVANVLIIG